MKFSAPFVLYRCFVHKFTVKFMSVFYNSGFNLKRIIQSCRVCVYNSYAVSISIHANTKTIPLTLYVLQFS